MYLPTIFKRMRKIIDGYAPAAATGTRKAQDATVSIQDAIVLAMSKDYDVTDGAEFIDDGMRMKEQPLSKVVAHAVPAVRPFAPLNISAKGSLAAAYPYRLPVYMPALEKQHHTPDEILSALKKEGYTEDFATDTDALYSGDMDIRFHPDDFSIDRTYRFNDDCGPNGNPIVYAITSKTGVKGILMDTTGSCSLHPDMVKKVYTP